MNRRNFLILSATAVSATAVGGMLVVFDNPHSYIPELLHRYIGEYRMDEEDERQFVDAFEDFYGSEKILGFVSLHHLREATSLGTDYTDERLDLYERRLVGDFMTSTDFFHKYQQQPVPHVSYTGFKRPCGNPFARRV